MKRYRFDPEARLEYFEIIRWYRQRSNVAFDFVRAVDEAIRRICETPRAYARAPGPADEEIRRHLIRRFPYAIVYLVDPKRVVILAIAHRSRHPNYWRDRVRR